MKPYVLALLIASLLAISSLGIGVAVIDGASQYVEDNDTCYYDITVFKYYDENENGIYDEGEEGLNDWYFELYGKGYENEDDRDHPPWYYLANGTTDSDGYITFEDYECGFPQDEIGHYKVREYIPEGWYNTGSAVYPTTENEEELTVNDEVIVENGENEEYDSYVEDSFWLREPMTVEFGNAMEDGEISVCKYHDMNMNGIYDEGEQMLPGWEFNLYSIGGEVGSRTPVDVVVMIDTSGSMAGTRISDAKSATVKFLDNLNENDRMALYTFDGFEDSYLRRAYSYMDSANKSSMESLINGLGTGGGTPIWDSIGDSVNYSLMNSRSGNVTEFSLILTDGGDYYYQPEAGSETYSAGSEPGTSHLTQTWGHPNGLKWGDAPLQFKDQNGPDEDVKTHLYDWVNLPTDGENRTGLIHSPIPVYTVGLGISPHEEDPMNPTIGNSYNFTNEYKLWQIAKTSGAEYFYAPESEELDQIFEDIFGSAVGKTLIDTKTTGSDGCLVFENLTPGDYIVEEELQENWDNTTGLSQNVTVHPAGEETLWFGNIKYSEITVNKFHDINYDGEFNGEEEMIDGFMFQLWKADEEGNPTEKIGEPVETENGTYTFEDLVPGDYVVQEIIPEVGEEECCWVNTTQLLQHVNLPLESTASYEMYFGNVRGGSIEGMKFLDIEADGHFDVGVDRPLEGWEINLWTVENGEPADIIETVETDRSGNYDFDCVLPGEYFVKEEMYEGWYNVTTDIQHVVVEPCETVTEIDFSNCMFKDIYGIKFYDYNMDGEFTEEDWVLEGWEINLWNEVDGEPGDIIETFYTQPNGYYFFEGLKVGTYYVQEEVPYGWDNTTESLVKIDLNCCTPCRYVNFGNYEFPEITINKFNDANMDGVYSEEDGDYLLEDEIVQFDVLGEFEGVQVFADTFDVEGSYNFLVPVGDFNITENLEAGWLNTTDLIQEMNLGPGDHWEAWFGNVQYGDIEVYKYYDDNMNGSYDEEEMLSDWTFDLWRTENGEAVEVIATNVTDEEGLAMFEDLEPGLYAVQEIEQDCWFNTTDLIQFVEVEAGNTSELWFGNVPGGFIEGYKFCDYNMNQEFDEIEYGLQGWTINLYPYHENDETLTSQHMPYMSTVTDEDGYYNFTCVKPGMYILEEEMHEGWHNSTPYYYEIEVLPEGELEYHFGNYRYGDITGLKYFDFNMNGEFEPEVGDIPLRGRTVELWEADVEGNISGEMAIDSTETDEHGYYIFEDVGPGDYVVYQPKPCCEWIHTTPREVHVRMGCLEESEVNFGEYKLSSIDVYIVGETGVDVNIYESNENGDELDMLESGETGDHGWYISEHLEPGYYLVKIEDGQTELVQLRMGEQVEFEYNDTQQSQNFVEAIYNKVE